MESESIMSSESSSSSETRPMVHHGQYLPLTQKYVLDLVLATYVLYVGLLWIPLNDVMMTKSCYFELKYNASICESLTNNSAFLNEVHRVTKYYGLASNIVASLPAAMSTIIASNFMTRSGMKVPVICAIVCTVITCALQLYSFVHMSLPLVFNVIFQIPQAIGGGQLVVMTAVQTRIALTTSAEDRKYRYFLLRYLLLLSNLIAVAIGTPLYKHHGPFSLAVLLIGSLLFSLILIVFVFRDLGVYSNESVCTALANSADFSTLRKGLDCLEQARPGHARAQIYFMLISLTIANIPYAGNVDGERKNLHSWRIVAVLGCLMTDDNTLLHHRN
ncbi:uncharacterized protein LOC100900100 [Galendromus occidentalis]|uniref:Uncharacterized protein LOC100900100 n=1 Tax=Galendromus occidentalis TaxID=34638 RepID=A0AAJ6QP33_9ACAR|nr:uncharacterized protein LOC100900100 [Galendromus occidentalis]